MDDTRLAHIVVDQLAPFLRNLMGKQPLSSNADLIERKAYALWDEIYPKVVLRSDVMQAARKLVEEDTPAHRETLSKQLALVFRINIFLADRIKQQLPAADSENSSEPTIPRPNFPTFTSRASAYPQEFGAEQISCQVCDLQDQSLRLVSYPFVFSLVVITFRRMFQGVYCARHANRYFILAAMITLSVGWMGIPFGLIFTPVALLNLFTSEKRLRPANAKLLMEIAKAKQEKGDLEGAASYYQESLWLEHKDAAKMQAKEVLAAQTRTEDLPLFFQIFSLLNGFAAAWLMGFLIGLVDGLVSTPFNDLQSAVSILVIIFSYLPLLFMLYFSSVVLARFVRRMLERTLISNVLVGRAVAGLTSVVAFYAILTGNFFFYVQTSGGLAADNLLDSIRINALLLVHGGWLSLVGLFQAWSTADLLFVALVIFGSMAFLWLGQDWAAQTVRWRQVLDQIQGITAHYSGTVAAVVAFLIVGIVFVFLGLVFFPSEIIAY